MDNVETTLNEDGDKCVNLRALESILKLNNQQMRKAALTRGEKEYHGYLFKLGTRW